MSLLRTSGSLGSLKATEFGYHKRQIAKGILGETSKIREELEELEDAMEQDNKIMALCELSDIYGALSALLTKQFPGITMQDLQTMSDATKRSFQVGHRK